ncbi:hypothetical protein MTO96_041452 [Rhipicephalus appendiculatus]
MFDTIGGRVVRAKALKLCAYVLILQIQADLTEFIAPGATKKSVAPYLKHFKLARGKLAEWGGNLTAMQFFYLNDTDTPVTTYFGCGDTLTAYNASADGGFLTSVMALSQIYACNVQAYSSKEILGFPVLGTEPYYDFIAGQNV